jgi:hypothetical protein
MKTFKVTFSYNVKVEAETAEEAEEKAYESFSDGLCYNDIRANEFNVSDPKEV